MTIWNKIKENENSIFEFIIIIFVTSFILFSIDIAGVFVNVTPDGGDYLFHYSRAYTFLHEVPLDRIQYWSNANNAGYAFLMYYPPFIIALIAYISHILPLPLVFKIVSLIGILLLPAIAFISIRKITKNMMAPLIAIVLLLLFLYQKDNFAYGGNINSAIVGEFCYSIAILFLLYYVAIVFESLKTGKNTMTCAVLMFLICITHPVPWILSLFIPFWGFFKYKSRDVFIHLSKIYTVGLLLCACWFVPYISKISYHTFEYSLRNVHAGMPYGWTLDKLKDIYPDLLIPIIILSIIFCLYLFVFRKSINDEISYIGFILLMSCTLFYFKPVGWAIRFLPFIYLFGTILVSLFIGAIFENKNKSYFPNLIYRNRKTLLVYIAIIVVIFISRTQVIKSVYATTVNMYYGVDGLRDSYDIHDASNFLSNLSDGARVASYSIKPEIIYILAGRGTTHGMFTYSYSNLFTDKLKSSIENGARTLLLKNQLEMFNSPWILPKENKTIKGIENSGIFDLVYTTGGNYSKKIYLLKNASFNYAYPLKQMPILYTDIDEWKSDSLDWFKTKASEPIMAFSSDNGDFERKKFLSGSFGSWNLTSYANPPDYLKNCTVDSILGNGTITLNTDCIGRAVLLKVSYHPNWKIKSGANKIYPAGPGMMLVFPESNKVVLYFGRTASDYVGIIMFIMGIVLFFFIYTFENKIDVSIQSIFGKSQINFILEKIETLFTWLKKFYFIIFLLIAILLLLTANIAINLGDKIVAERKYSNAMKLMSSDHISEAIDELNSISFTDERLTQNKEFYLALLNLQEHNLGQGRLHTYRFVGKDNNTERSAMIRYYFVVELGNKNMTDELLQEVNMMRSVHPNSEWRAKVEEYFTSWKIRTNYTEYPNFYS